MKRKMPVSQMVKGVLGNLCPVCQKGKVFYGLLVMNAYCQNCSQKFRKEPGYFLGAWIASYFLGAFSVVPLLLAGFLFFHWDFWTVIILAAFQLTLLTPLLLRFSKLTWLWIEARVTLQLDGE